MSRVYKPGQAGGKGSARYLAISLPYQGHRGVKQRTYPLREFGNVDATSRFWRAFDEQRQSFRMRADAPHHWGINDSGIVPGFRC